MDISFLFEPPELNQEALLEITPLAPISMVSSLPGSFYKADLLPSKIKLCGLFENLLEWHFTPVDRKKIIKNIVKSIRKSNKNLNKDTFIRSGDYLPILPHHFEMGIVFNDEPQYFSDLWSQKLTRLDGSYPHPNGTMNLSYHIIGKKNKLREENGAISNEQIGIFFKEHEAHYPQYYSAPRLREYIEIAFYKIQLNLSTQLYNVLFEQLKNNNLGYLGNSEGWVDVKLLSNEQITAFL